MAYDNNETLQLKTDYARENCLGGSLVWSVDMENPKEKMDPKISGSCPKSVVPWAVLGLSFLCSFFFVV